MARYLFIHQNFPGQFLHVAKKLADFGHDVVAIGEKSHSGQSRSPHPGIRLVTYPRPAGAGSRTHHYLRGLEAHVRRGQEIVRVCQGLIAAGFRPDVVVAHPGWGEGLFLREIFPKASIVHYLEFYYRNEGADVGFDPEFPATLDDQCRVRVKNATQLLGFEGADAGISPTLWQKSRYPADWLPRIAQCHEGVDTRNIRPDPSANFSIGKNGNSGSTARILSCEDEVVTYVARNLEPYRGFHTFMRAIPEVLDRRPQARIIIVGGDEVSYGRPLHGGITYREHYIREWGKEVDQSRVHFLGRVPFLDFLHLLQVATLHVYLTYPFVLSWSMLQAMSAGCPVLASATAPVTEVIRDSENGFLTDFFDATQLANRIVDLLGRRHDLSPVREAARNTIVKSFDLDDICLPQMLKILSVHADRHR